jgi:hypothetical protein
MLADFAHPEHLLHIPGRDTLDPVVALLHPEWRAEALTLLAETRWREQLVACAAIVLAGSDVELNAALWRALDGGSWVAPQLVATAFLVDPEFEPRAEERLLAVTRRSPKAVASLVRAYHRLPRPRMNVVARLARHDAQLATEDGRIAIRAVDGWLDRLSQLCDAPVQACWLRHARALAT